MGLAPPPTRRQELADFLRQRRAVTRGERWHPQPLAGRLNEWNRLC